MDYKLKDGLNSPYEFTNGGLFVVIANNKMRYEYERQLVSRINMDINLIQRLFCNLNYLLGENLTPEFPGSNTNEREREFRSFITRVNKRIKETAPSFVFFVLLTRGDEDGNFLLSGYKTCCDGRPHTKTGSCNARSIYGEIIEPIQEHPSLKGKPKIFIMPSQFSFKPPPGPSKGGEIEPEQAIPEKSDTLILFYDSETDDFTHRFVDVMSRWRVAINGAQRSEFTMYDIFQRVSGEVSRKLITGHPKQRAQSSASNIVYDKQQPVLLSSLTKRLPFSKILSCQGAVSADGGPPANKYQKMSDDKDSYKIDKKGLFVILMNLKHNFCYPNRKVDWSTTELKYMKDKESLVEEFALDNEHSLKTLDTLLHSLSIEGRESGNDNVIMPKGGQDVYPDDCATAEHAEHAEHEDFKSFMKRVKRAAQEQKPSFVFVVLMSHGFDDGSFLLAADEGCLDNGCSERKHTFQDNCVARRTYEDFIQPIQGCSPPQAPKLFVVQTCRGGRMQVVLKEGSNTDTPLKMERPKMEMADTLIMYACVQSHISWVPSNGSLLVQSLCDAIRRERQRAEDIELSIYDFCHDLMRSDDTTPTSACVLWSTLRSAVNGADVFRPTRPT